MECKLFFYISSIILDMKSKLLGLLDLKKTSIHRQNAKNEKMLCKPGLSLSAGGMLHFVCELPATHIKTCCQPYFVCKQPATHITTCGQLQFFCGLPATHILKTCCQPYFVCKQPATHITTCGRLHFVCKLSATHITTCRKLHFHNLLYHQQIHALCLFLGRPHQNNVLSARAVLYAQQASCGQLSVSSEILYYLYYIILF